MSWHSRLRNLFRPGRLSREFDDEMRFHVDARADDLVAAGRSRDDARREALRMFGNTTAQKEKAREFDIYPFIESVANDIRYAVRALTRSPGFAFVAILSLALGIGANTAIFSLIDTVMLRTLPVRQPEELVQVTLGDNGSDLTNPIWEQLRDRQDVFAGLGAFFSGSFDMATGGEERRVAGLLVSGDFFNTFGVQPAAGRLLQRADDARGCPAVAVVGAGFAEGEYGSVENAVGKSLSLKGHPFEIVGVTDPAFFGPEVGGRARVYAPLCADEILDGAHGFLDERSSWLLSVYGRQAEGSTRSQLAARLNVLAPAILAATEPPNWTKDMQRRYLRFHFEVVPAATGGSSGLRDGYGAALFVLMGVVGVVLLIACANVAHLLLARAAARQREMAIRLAIGAGRGRLVRQMLTESLLLSLAGATLGALFAGWASGMLVGFLATRHSAVWVDLSIDGRVLGFTIAVATMTGVLFGLAPAWKSTGIDPQRAMKANGRGVVDGESRVSIGKVLVVGQVALSLVLVVTAGLLIGSLYKLETLDPGFQREGVLLVSISLDKTRYPDAKRRELTREVIDRLRGSPGVVAAGASTFTPISGSAWNGPVLVDGFIPKTRTEGSAFYNGVSDGYFSTLGTAVLAGRDFTPRDDAGSALVAAINQTMARRVFGTSNPLGKFLRRQVGDSVTPPVEIVAVVHDAKYRSLKEEPIAIAYFPIAQADDHGRPNLEVRTRGTLAALVPVVKDALRATVPGASYELMSMDEQVSASLTRARLLGTLSGFFGGLALLLAVVGLYGTMSYSVNRRRGEIGVRLALGAVQSRVVRMIVGEVGRLVAAGVLVGALLSVGVMRVISSFLFGLTPTDPTTILLSIALLALVSLCAGLVPAWRAARMDPMEALGED